MIASMTTGAELVENFIHQEPDNKLDQLSVIYDQIKAKWGGADIEYAGAIHWSNIKQDWMFQEIATGMPNRVKFEVINILRHALIYDTKFVVLVHNHPNGKAVPSEQDLNQTREILRIARMLNFKVIDHVIITDGELFSFHEEGYL